ncbi:2,3-bisphosphoglycerate-independent phosphoglycerate mutase [Candidatus Parcubacteria bacterium]|jgi:2,3-bisphosphoglycerate-independent phosphoglycerate mutase|nr:MAG: 2,3-bisphosphoglycerate-independent phosphoglycerate mutase [Candidatus Parcubacteria bacterium]
MKRTIVLAILDGWGIGTCDESNPIYSAHPPTILEIEKNYPCGALQASGLAIGLPWEEEGNSEVGHLTIGTGSVFYQNYPKISLAIENGTFFSNEALVGAYLHAQKNESALHLIGLISKGNVHSSLNHLEALIIMAERMNIKKCYIHAITDGRDSPPESVISITNSIEEIVKQHNVGMIVAVVGRYYAMNRDEHWDRTKMAYDLFTKDTYPIRTIDEAAKKIYARGYNDEFIDPTAVTEHKPITDNDAIIFFNFREDSMRQLISAFCIPEFDKFPTKKLNNCYIATFTQYLDTISTHVAFPKEVAKTCLSKIFSDLGKQQLHIAETQKYAHVTYFFNGLIDAPFPNEYRVLIPTLDIPHPEQKPEMMASAITDRVLLALRENTFDFIVVNYANPDIMAHTGNYNATLEAVYVIDKEIRRLYEAVQKENHMLLITSDHGNAEVLLNINTGEPETKHNPNPVPFYLIANEFKKTKPREGFYRLRTIGILSDVAPTILELAKIQKPLEMTGQSLLSQLKYM